MDNLFSINLPNVSIDSFLKFELFQALRECKQDPIYHPEGDVFTHTKMVCESLKQNQLWKNLDDTRKFKIYCAALFHDIGKPLTISIENNRIHNYGHSCKGASVFRELAYYSNLDYKMREEISALIRWHSIPLKFLMKKLPERSLIRASMTCRLDDLHLLSTADTYGRDGDHAEAIESLLLFQEMAKELGIWEKPFAFKSTYCRLCYFNDERKSPNIDLYDNREFDVLVMSGLPASGKSKWVKENCPDWNHISLDEIRNELGIAPTSNQGRVIQLGREKAKRLMARKQSFVWNATNLTKKIRMQLTNLIKQYRGKVKIVYLESNRDTIFSRNATRSKSVPNAVLEKLISKFEPPDLTEADQVVRYVN